VFCPYLPTAGLPWVRFSSLLKKQRGAAATSRMRISVKGARTKPRTRKPGFRMKTEALRKTKSAAQA